MTKHYRVSPSGIERIIECPGSITLPQDNFESEYASEGTLAHHVAACKVLGDLYDPVDEEIERCTDVYADFIVDLVSSCPTGSQTIEHVEQTLESENIADFGGTPDYAMVSGVKGHIVDHKHGAGVYVDAVGNRQLLCYALLLSEKYPEISDWSLTIIQPRIGDSPIRTWEVTRDELTQLAETIVDAIDDAESETPSFNHGSHCRWCHAILHCKHLEQKRQEEAEMSFADIEDDQDVVQKCKDVIETAPALAALEKAAKAYLESKLRKGESVEGYKMVASYSNRQYNGTDAEVLKRLRSRGVGKRVATEAKLLPITKLEKRIPKKKLDGLVVRKLKGHKLVTEDARGEAVVFSDPVDAFGEIPTEKTNE